MICDNIRQVQEGMCSDLCQMGRQLQRMLEFWLVVATAVHLTKHYNIRNADRETMCENEC